MTRVCLYFGLTWAPLNLRDFLTLHYIKNFGALTVLLLLRPVLPVQCGVHNILNDEEPCLRIFVLNKRKKLSNIASSKTNIPGLLPTETNDPAHVG